MGTKIIGSIISKEGVKYYVRYSRDDRLLEISTFKFGPWLVIREDYYLDNDALIYAQEFVDNSFI